MNSLPVFVDQSHGFRSLRGTSRDTVSGQDDLLTGISRSGTLPFISPFSSHPRHFDDRVSVRPEVSLLDSSFIISFKLSLDAF